MKEIGGYIELDTYTLPMLHDQAVALNCGRNALAYLIEARGISKLCLPYFLCDSVRNVCGKYGTALRFYHIRPDFTPDVPELEKDEWLYVVNYYGQLTRGTLETLHERFPRMIVDNAQDYFARPLEGVDTLYTCRKYFGVPDGAFLYTEAALGRELPMDESYERIHYILGRYERTASEFYGESSANNKLFAGEPVKRMSRLTQNLLHGVDYERVRRVRTENFRFLSEGLGELNGLSVRVVQGAFMYPFLTPHADRAKKRMLERKMYIPTLWPNVLKDVPEDWLEWHYAKYILPLPCDQRYGPDEMAQLVETIKEELL